MTTTNTNRLPLFSEENINRTVLLGDLRDVADLNDAAVNTVRDYCRARGYNAAALLREERARMEDLTFAEYLRVARVGSRFCLTRVARRAVWAAVATFDAAAELKA